MHQRDVCQLSKGDYIILKNSPDGGRITEIRMTETQAMRGRYPMIQYRDKATGALKWCTYLRIDTHSH